MSLVHWILDALLALRGRSSPPPLRPSLPPDPVCTCLPGRHDLGFVDPWCEVHGTTVTT